MSAAHDTATGLVNGKVLVAGVTGLAGQPADLYDPASDSFRPTRGLFPFAASATIATRLLNGRVLFSGGFAFRYESDGAFLYFPYGQGFGQRYSSLPSHDDVGPAREPHGDPPAKRQSADCRRLGLRAAGPCLPEYRLPDIRNRRAVRSRDPNLYSHQRPDDDPAIRPYGDVNLQIGTGRSEAALPGFPALAAGRSLRDKSARGGRVPPGLPAQSRTKRGFRKQWHYLMGRSRS